MADQGAIIITMAMATQEVKARGTFVAGDSDYSATLRAVGCLVEGTDATETHAAVQIGGTALASYAGTVAAGALLQADAAGQLIAAVAVTGIECAIALEGGAADELRRVKIL